MAESRAERLCKLLTMSNSRHCIAGTCLSEQLLDVCRFSKEINTVRTTENRFCSLGELDSAKELAKARSGDSGNTG